MKNFNIQLYSVRHSLEKDFDGTLKALADMGYDGVEFAGNYGGYDGEQLKKKLDYYGLSAISAHLSLDQFLNDFEYHADILKTVGCRILICPFTAPKTIEEACEYGEKLVKVAEKCMLHGFEFGYHNHAHEFKLCDEQGNNAFDIMMEIGDPLVLTEMDLGWVAVAGKNPEDYIRKYAGRVTCLHLKQFKKQEDGSFVGSTFEDGVVDIENCIKVGSLMGCEHFIVEHEPNAEKELEDVKKNIEFLKNTRS